MSTGTLITGQSDNKSQIIDPSHYKYPAYEDDDDDQRTTNRPVGVLRCVALPSKNSRALPQSHNHHHHHHWLTACLWQQNRSQQPWGGHKFNLILTKVKRILGILQLSRILCVPRASCLIRTRCGAVAEYLRVFPRHCWFSGSVIPLYSSTPPSHSHRRSQSFGAVYDSSLAIRTIHRG